MKKPTKNSQNKAKEEVIMLKDDKYPATLHEENLKANPDADNNVNKENIFKKMAAKIRSGRIDDFINVWNGKAKNK